LNSLTFSRDRNGKSITAVDLFAGAGGSSVGAEAAGVQVVAAVDAWDMACLTYGDNHRDTTIYNSLCEEVDPYQIVQEKGDIDLLLASPECTNHTCAKGGVVRCERSRETALQVLRFAQALLPRWIVMENVIQMRNWDRYNELITSIEELGYYSRAVVLNAADFGVPQSRRRLFVLFDRERMPPDVVPPIESRIRSVKSVIHTGNRYRYTPLYTPRRAPATVKRAQRAISKVGEDTPFLIVYYGNDGSGGWQSIDVPLRTLTTLDRFAYVRPTEKSYEMRMLQVPEIQQIMGFSSDYLFGQGTRRDRIKLLGNAVCPPVMTAIISTLLTGGKNHVF